MAIVEHVDVPNNGTSRPVPDPTALTNELVTRAISSLRDVIETRIDAIDARVNNSVATITKHTDIAVEQSITLTEEKIKALTEAVTVFKQTVNERFQLGDVQTEKAARDVKSAVDAAFAAAKEAVGEQNKSNALSIAKSETATAKQIDQLVESQRASAKNTDDKIETLKQAVEGKNADLKDRFAPMEARITAVESRSGGFNQAGVLIVGAFAILASLAAIVTLITHFAK
jgi:hypothetical protein